MSKLVDYFFSVVRQVTTFGFSIEAALFRTFRNAYCTAITMNAQKSFDIRR